MSRISTRSGDGGVTSLTNGDRVSKDSLRVESYGTVDELDSYLGLCRVEILESVPISPEREILIRAVECAQDAAWVLGAMLAAPDQTQDDRAAALGGLIELLTKEIEHRLEPVTHFLAPGVSRAESCLHVARAVCRRAERRVVALDISVRDSTGVCRGDSCGSRQVILLNRLSDLLFVMARLTLRAQGRIERYR